MSTKMEQQLEGEDVVIKIRNQRIKRFEHRGKRRYERS